MKALMAVVIGLLAATLAHAGPGITVQWNMPTNNVDGTPLTDLAGAKIYYGTESRVYTEVVDAGNTNTLTVTGLVEGVTYYFTATAYNTAGLESDFCNEASRRYRIEAPPGTVLILAAAEEEVWRRVLRRANGVFTQVWERVAL